MSGLFNAIAYGFGSSLMFLYNNLWFNYGLAIIILTIILRVVLLPLAIKSFNSMARMNEVQPLMAEIQRKYKNDKEAMNRELMKLYQEKKVNPFGGCLPLLLQIPILYGLFLVISKPLTFMFNYTPQQIENLTKFLGNNQYKEVAVVKAQNLLNLNFLGINLGDIPQFIMPTTKEQFMLFFIPVLAGVTTYLSSKYNQIPVKESDQNEMQKSMQKQMMIMMPLMAVWFSFVVPAGLSLYWLISNLFQMIQQKYLINIYLKK